MAIVTLYTVWLNSITEPSDYATFPTMSALKISPSKDGKVRRLANGRLRAVTHEGIARTAALTLPYCDRDQVTWLEDHVAELVCVRDDRGRKLFGMYFSVNLDEARYSTEFCNASVTLNEVTHSEGLG